MGHQAWNGIGLTCLRGVAQTGRTSWTALDLPRNCSSKLGWDPPKRAVSFLISLDTNPQKGYTPSTRKQIPLKFRSSSPAAISPRKYVVVVFWAMACVVFEARPKANEGPAQGRRHLLRLRRRGAARVGCGVSDAPKRQGEAANWELLLQMMAFCQSFSDVCFDRNWFEVLWE